MLFLAIVFWPISVPLLVGYGYLLFRAVKKPAYGMLAIAILAPYLAYKAFLYHWYVQVLPEQLEVTYPVSINEEGGFMEGCSVAVFKLSDKTVQAVRKNGLTFFAAATQARGYPDEIYYQYDKWNETPVPEIWTREGSWMMCPDMSNTMHSQIVKAAQRNGAYYTHTDEGQLIVIPSLGIVVFSSWG
ncbi:hypothetical protein [Noviherbaspirillum massiliense]|uniref:hypothetical protein n=1 Tax=Noviherbaspirillum massiliense TaxID=1465823 RepID=UPI0002E09805|nr:hypothetical protein [Noviherbaspirillum massiliense]